ncbi:bifunctional DNA-formamidopyrimidine glycosylase/DNA-(apurinic or apyrimidinic site) lyase, partial [Francisella tularensis subsp. holarctica]|nr:bifunctional DNA-formamidopyrimidine glycosylase/DNA-(apurinic or apyrimidinic site) lyase [Francisella tularensis subsp. holarctica]
SIKKILEKPITQGGTTLKDYKNTDLKTGYFTQQLNVYCRNEQQCYVCNTKIKIIVKRKRNT